MTHNKSTFNGQRITFLLLIVIGGFFLWTEHSAHILGVLPYLVLLLCPILHIFMHKGHGGHNGRHDDHRNHQGGTS